MKKEFLIRPGKVEDAPGITYVQTYTWKTTYSGLMPEEILDNRIKELPKRTENTRRRLEAGEPYLVAEAEGKIVGMAVCLPSRNPDYPEDGEIQAIYILKEYQKVGIGRQLFSGCMRSNSSLAWDEKLINRSPECELQAPALRRIFPSRFFAPIPSAPGNLLRWRRPC